MLSNPISILIISISIDDANLADTPYPTRGVEPSVLQILNKSATQIDRSMTDFAMLREAPGELSRYETLFILSKTVR